MAIYIRSYPAVGTVNSHGVKVSNTFEFQNHARFERYWGGDGQLFGQVFVAKLPKQARIDVYETESKLFVRSVMTNIVGEFVITNIDPNYQYDLVAVDPEGVWEKKVSSARTPI